MEKVKIYLSGPISGIPNDNIDGVEKAYVYYNIQGFEVINPHHIAAALNDDYMLEGLGKPSYTDYLAMCIANLNECNILILLDGYKKSFGACMEIAFALKKGLPVLHAFTDKKVNLQAHIAIVSAYDSLSNRSQLQSVLETVTV